MWVSLVHYNNSSITSNTVFHQFSWCFFIFIVSLYLITYNQVRLQSQWLLFKFQKQLHAVLQTNINIEISTIEIAVCFMGCSVSFFCSKRSLLLIWITFQFQQWHFKLINILETPTDFNYWLRGLYIRSFHENTLFRILVFC